MFRVNYLQPGDDRHSGTPFQEVQIFSGSKLIHTCKGASAAIDSRNFINKEIWNSGLASEEIAA